MKLFLKKYDDGEIIFIPDYLFVDNFKKLLRKKDIVFKRNILHYIIEFLIVDKKNKPNGFEINFHEIEKIVSKSYKKADQIGGKRIRQEEGDIFHRGISLPKDNLNDVIKQYERNKKKYEIISFEHIFKNEFSRVFFCDYLIINFNKASKKTEIGKNIHKHVVGSALFYIEFYEKILKPSIWFKNYKKNYLIMIWLAENTANLIINNNEDISTYNPELLDEIFSYYFKNLQVNFPIYTFEDMKKRYDKLNSFAALSASEKQEMLEIEENKYKTEVPNLALNVIEAYLQIAKIHNVEINNDVIKDITIKVLQSNISEETEFKEESQFLFNNEKVFEYIKSDKKLFNSETLIYLANHITNENLLILLYEELKAQNKIKLSLFLPLITNKSYLREKIIKDYWLELVKLVTKQFSEKSHTYEKVLSNIIQIVQPDIILGELLVKKRMNYPLATQFLEFYKKEITKKEFTNISQKIINEINFQKFDIKKAEYFELLDGDVITQHFLEIDKKELEAIVANKGLFEFVLKLKNKYIIPKILASVQLVDINVFENTPTISSSKYFWTAFEHNLKDKNAVSNNICLTSSTYFSKFILRSEGVKWLRSDTGKFWLSLPESRAWKQSPEGIFVQRIVLENQSFLIDTEEVFKSYIEILQKITKEKIDNEYLINNIPETFSYLLKNSPELILLINFDNFDRYDELLKIIKTNIPEFLENQNNDIVLKSLSSILHENSHKVITNPKEKIEENFDYLYANSKNWFTSEDFHAFMIKHNSDDIYIKLFKKSIDGLSKTTQLIAENLIKVSNKQYLDLIIENKNIPFWLTKNVFFVELIKKSSKESRVMVNLIGNQYFQTGFRKSLEEHREWFTEFVNLFGFKNRKILRPQLIASLNKDCNSTICKTRKTGKEKEGFRDFYDVFLATAFYSNSFNTVQRPYKCTESKLWHKTSDWG